MNDAKKPAGSTVESPCVRNCCLDDDDICLGCHRSLTEICTWHSASDEQRRAVLSRCGLRKALRELLPRVVAWAQAQSEWATLGAAPLTSEEEAIARAVGVAHPERIRIERVDELPAPEDRAVRAAGEQAGLLSPDMVGLTLGYAVFVRRGHDTRRLLSHEFRHVQQYEQHASIARFLPVYFRQIVEQGYANAPFELDARAHELT